MTFNKQSITLLLSELERHNISKHILCPSSISLFHSIGYHIPQAIAIIDERSVGYIATGMCAELDEPVVIWCMDNDSFRNLAPALTEAYYRKLPILVVAIKYGETLNQSVNPQDTIRYYINDSSDIETKINSTIEYLKSEVQGPVYFSLGDVEAELILHENTPSERVYVDVSNIIDLLPLDSCVHFGAGISFKSTHPKEIQSREEHFGKDGNLSMLIGSSIVCPNQLHVGIFFYEEVAYDLNMLGNRHIGNNLVVIALKQEQQSSVILEFANKMSWQCMQIPFQEISKGKRKIAIEDNPQYMEAII